MTVKVKSSRSQEKQNWDAPGAVTGPTGQVPRILFIIQRFFGTAAPLHLRVIPNRFPLRYKQMQAIGEARPTQSRARLKFLLKARRKEWL